MIVEANPQEYAWCEGVEFRECADGYAAFIETEIGTVGVKHEKGESQESLVFYPPVAVWLASFDDVVSMLCDEEDSRYANFSVDTFDGEVRYRVDLEGGGKDEISSAIRDSTAFLVEVYPAMLAVIAHAWARPLESEREEDEEQDGSGGPWLW